MGGQRNGTWTPTKRRGPIAAEFTTPGPATIALPSTLGPGLATKARAPAFTISGRHETKGGSSSPGPGQYNVNGLTCRGREEPHAPSLHIRPRDPKAYVTPAPGDYCPEKGIKKVLDASPRFSFGMKTDTSKGSDIPAPNTYNIPSYLGNTKVGGVQAAPSFTIAGRPKDEEDKMKVPGPGAYGETIVDVYKTVKSPAFSMGQRTNIPSDSTMKPGPGAHSPEKCLQDHGPEFSMGLRFKDLSDKIYLPGPGSYDAGDIDKCRKKLPAFSIAYRTPVPTDKSPKPAPNAYCPEKCRLDEGPKFTMGQQLKPAEDKADVPGPGTYESGDLNKCREKIPAFSLGIRTSVPVDKSPKPAPNAYAPEKSDLSHSPHFSFGVKHSPYIGKLRDQ